MLMISFSLQAHQAPIQVKKQRLEGRILFNRRKVLNRFWSLWNIHLSITFWAQSNSILDSILTTGTLHMLSSAAG